MGKAKSEQNKKFRILKAIGKYFLLLLLVLVIIAIILWRELFVTMFSVKNIGTTSPVYEEKICGDVYFDKYMNLNSPSKIELDDFLIHSLGHGLLDGIDFKPTCSAFCVKTPDGDVLLCNNVDQPKLTSTPVVMEAQLLGKKTIGFTNMKLLTNKSEDSLFNRVLMYLMPYTTYSGINEDGLAIGIAGAEGSYQKYAEGTPWISQFTLPQLILSNATNVEEAIALMQKYNIDTKSYRAHYMLADASGNCAIVEWNGEMEIYRPEKNYLVMSNFRMHYMSGFGKDRYDNYISALDSCDGIVTEDEALELLKANRIAGDEFVSVVYNLTKMTARMYFARSDVEKVYSFSE